MATEITGEFLYQFAIAGGLGALIGLEREHRQDEVQVIAGVRTFPLVSLSGFMIGLLSRETGSDLVVAAGILCATLFAATFHVVRHRLGTSGLTTPMAMLVTFLIGLLIAYAFVLEAIVIGVVTTFLLLTKSRLHRFAFHLDDAEMMSALQFITVLFILFPLAGSLDGPVEGTRGLVGPGLIIDPYRILVLVIFVSSISFVSFLAMREAGPERGIVASGLLGGLVNSEATTVSLARHAGEVEALVPAAVTGTLLSTATMVVRNMVIAIFVDPSLGILLYVLPASLLIGAASLLFAWRRYRTLQSGSGNVRITIKSPFAVGPALRFALWFAVVSAFATFVSRNPDLIGDWGIYLTALGAFGSAGAVVASVAALYAGGGLPLATAGLVAGLAILIGAANKLIILRATSASVFNASWKAFTVVSLLGVAGIAVSLVLFPL
ncbi:MAG TPA: DUF4010 domain-containing protein [Candidatus Thermoplasmatota archaeon]|nr:DUF4010 domain-containing protein [Candidatus Thermoplasmatota archaeon]